MICKDVSAETMYDVLHDIEYRRKWDTNVIETFDIGKLTVNADVGYYSCMSHAHADTRAFTKASCTEADTHMICALTALHCSLESSRLLTGSCPKPLRNRDVITLRSWLPIGKDYIIMNYSVKHAVSMHTCTHARTRIRPVHPLFCADVYSSEFRFSSVHDMCCEMKGIELYQNNSFENC